MRVWLPPDANTLLAVADHCLRSRDLVNVIVAGKQPAPQFLDMDAAIRHTHQGRRDLGLGEQRPGRRARRGDGVRRRRADARDARRGRHPARAGPGAAGARGQRRRPDDAAARVRASARPVRPRVRRDLHARQADHLRLPRLPVADPPADLPAHQPREPPRARLQGGGHDHHAVRHVRAERDRPLQPRLRRARPRAAARARRRLRAPRDARQAHRAQARTSHEHGIDLPEVLEWTWPAGREGARAQRRLELAQGGALRGRGGRGARRARRAPCGRARSAGTRATAAPAARELLGRGCPPSRGRRAPRSSTAAPASTRPRR